MKIEMKKVFVSEQEKIYMFSKGNLKFNQKAFSLLVWMCKSFLLPLAGNKLI